jgi:cytochrome c-type biogenesis protein CcmF
LVAWRRASLRGLARIFAIPVGIALGVGVVLIALGAGSSTPGLIAYTFSAFVLATIGQEFWRGTAARRATSGENVVQAFAQLVARNRRRYGGYIVHAAIVLLAIGIAGSSAYDSVAEKRLAKDQSLAVGGYTLTYRSLTERQAANAIEVRAGFDVARGGRQLGTVSAGKNAYAIEQQVSNEVGIRTNYLTGEDLFVIAEKTFDDGSVQVRVFVKPLVNLIWLAGLVFLLGSLITLWPDAREERRLVERYATGRAAEPPAVA